MAQARSASGFTLIEILVTLAIVALTTTFAVSSYRGHIVRSQRVEAAQALLAIAAEQEKLHLSSGSYSDRLDAGRDDELPGIPVASTTPRGIYRLRIEEVDAVGFVAAAERLDRDADPSCVRLSIDQGGRRLARDGADRDTTSLCW